MNELVNFFVYLLTFLTFVLLRARAHMYVLLTTSHSYLSSLSSLSSSTILTLLPFPLLTLVALLTQHTPSLYKRNTTNAHTCFQPPTIPSEALHSLLSPFALPLFHMSFSPPPSLSSQHKTISFFLSPCLSQSR